MKRSAPAALRNRHPILSVLERVLAGCNSVLEVASGSGEHAVFFANQLRHLTWQPSDVGADEIASIAAWVDEAKLGNLAPPILLDVTASPWPVVAADAVVNINMIHISPWTTCVGLLHGAAALLSSNGLLYLYGPFRRADRATAPSNEEFDRSLRRRDPAWGLRRLEDVAGLAGEHGFALEEVIDMPANNLSVLFRRE